MSAAIADPIAVLHLINYHFLSFALHTGANLQTYYLNN
ncbi:hypothetical protein D088_730005 [Salmonella enterica subsp. houtenae serovar 16:z4,z32:-- str. RKS3027]|nr:hypothetical protein D088_730005 [Salmonella enterica subsp. houtenae serovar 16:z4,z32:-- str. RKS3027]